jgi:hypothetical protein
MNEPSIRLEEVTNRGRTDSITMVMANLSQTKSHPNGGDFALSALFKGDTTDSSCQ